MTRPLLHISDLRKHFGGVKAIQGVSLDVFPNELVCVIGANGAGKSTLLNMVCGVSRCDGGEISFDGIRLSGSPAFRFARAGILRKFQVPSVFPSLTVEENLVVSAETSGKAAALSNLPDLMARLGLDAHAGRVAGELAHGLKQWLELGLCLVHEPKLLLLDEPTAGMTREESTRTALLVKELSRTCTTIVVEHDMSFVGNLDCRTCVMHQGQLIRDGKLDEIRNDSFIRDIYLGHH